VFVLVYPFVGRFVSTAVGWLHVVSVFDRPNGKESAILLAARGKNSVA
jgi:hypothetical protein